MKKKWCVFGAIGLACFLLVIGCIYAIASNFGKTKEEITVFAPDGAPALALAKLLDEDDDKDGVNYSVVSATGIEARVTYEDETKNADVCILPLTDASLHLSDGQNYQLVGVVTHGNFFLLSENGETQYTTDNLSDLIGKKIGFVQLGKLPGLVFQSILKRENIPYKVQSDLASCEENVVNLVNVKPTDVKKNVGFDVFAVPEPAATAKIKGAGFSLVGSVQALYGGENGYAQAVVVAKRSIIKNNAVWLDKFVAMLKENASGQPNDWLKTVNTEKILTAINSHLDSGLTPSFTENNLTSGVISACGVRYAGGYSSKTEINALIAALKEVNPNAVKDFSDDFFTEKY